MPQDQELRGEVSAARRCMFCQFSAILQEVADKVFQVRVKINVMSGFTGMWCQVLSSLLIKVTCSLSKGGDTEASFRAGTDT